MQQQSMNFKMEHMDFVDLGIVLQNNKINKRVFFFKAVHHNRNEKVREVFLFAVSED